jgi:threonine dehydratase
MRPTDSNLLAPIPLEAIRAARERIAGLALRTPLVRLDAPEAPAEIWLKLETLQPIGSFKLRGAGNALAAAARESLAGGVVTASAGNMAQGLAWAARERGVACTVAMPESAPATKRAAVERLGGRIVSLPYDAWWRAIETGRCPGVDGAFVHPVADAAVIAGNGTIGLEILDDLPDADTVLVPYGGGGLSCGIASAIRALRPEARVVACEVDTAAPLAASLEAGEPREIERTPSFVDGIGGKSLLPAMWPLARALLAGSLVVPLAEVAAAIRLLAERARVVAEGAGAVAVAAALSGRAGGGKIVCVVSGGNIDAALLARILAGETPEAPR